MPTNFCLTNQNQPINTLEKKFGFHTYTLNGSNIATTDCIKDLSTNINFRHHYEKLIAGAYRKCKVYCVEPLLLHVFMQENNYI